MKPNRLSPITLTTDFGTQDGYVAQMKGVIIGINPDARILDVTHGIRPFSIMEAALVLKGLAPHFPEGAIHVAVVDPGVGGGRRGVALRADKRFFVGPDNGLFSLVIPDDQPWEMREITNPDYTLPNPHPTFHGRDIFAPVAAHLSEGKPFEDVGPLVHDPRRLPVPEVKRMAHGLEGEVIYLDRFGNLTTNIEASMLDRPVKSVVLGIVEIHGISTFFCQGEEGKPLALVNSFGYLEIAVNRGDASEVLGIDKGRTVRVLWADQ